MSTSNETTHLNRPLRERLFDDIDSLVLVYVRVGIGIAIYFWAWFYTHPVDYDGEMLPLYDPVFMKPRFLFKYAGFEWVKLWPGNGMGWHFFITKVAAITLAIGFLTRLSGAVLCGAIAYVLLVERQIYLNHYYLLSCLAGLMLFLPAGRRLSVDSFLGIEHKSQVFKRWQFWLLRFQVGIPYVYGAIAKMNSDWLAGQPAGIYLEQNRDVGLVDAYLQIPGAVLMFAWGGLLYDLLVVPMLMYRKTRWLAIAMSIVFHVTNSQIFNIGVFPWFMLIAIVVFFPEDSIAKLTHSTRAMAKVWLSKYSDTSLSYRQAFQSIQKNEHPDPLKLGDQGASSMTLFAKCGFAMAIVYVSVQLILPLRHWVLPGNPAWNERGHRFAWRMMLRNKTVLTTFKVVAPDGSYQFFPSTVVMTHYQSSRAERIPELMRQAAVELKKMAKQTGVDNAKVYCLCLTSLNGRRPRPIIDTNIDLASAKRGWLVDDWVLQNHGPLPRQTWDRDKTKWWRQLVLPEQFKQLEMRNPSELEAFVEQQRQQALRHNSTK
ncbi:HTTM domain-containing protein [Planctomycetes bacterium K23_9]|uniref:Vitamin K-dependent gamma-carboxylase n=1 Tax=Stieleria marina TaxID=1930275 RepID=A0A517P183_9BACT|nr:Vitamin K-dependent gamma-carboxylase [Planctomycetes bacterium K23_9]